jgi:hypothetical protein
MADYDAWLNSMINMAGDVGEKKRKLFYDAKKSELDKQYGTMATPYGPGYEQTKLHNVGQADVARIGAKKDIDVANITGTAHTTGIGMQVAQEQRKTDLTSPVLENENANIRRSQRIGAAANAIDIASVAKAAKTNIGTMEKSAEAQSIVAQHESVNPGWPQTLGNAVTNIGKAGASLLYGLPNWKPADLALESQGLSRSDILGPKDWANMKKTQEDERKKKTLLRQY